MTPDEQLVEQYAVRIEPLLPLAKRAFGSRDTVSPQHDASREYTRLLVEFTDQGGSLLKLAKRLDVQYAGLRRRVTTSDVPASSHRPRKKFDQSVYDAEVDTIRAAKDRGTYDYHLALHSAWERGLSLTRIASMLGLSSANPCYYGVNKIKQEKMVK